MHHIPLTIVDDFFEDPDGIRNFALKQQFYRDFEGKWPGLRTEGLHLLDNNLFDLFCNRFFSLFFDINNVDWKLDAKFQKIGKEYGSGWAHSDIGPIITGIIYLNPVFTPNSGTLILEKNTIRSNVRLNDRQNEKVDFYNGKIDQASSEKFRAINNNEFHESLKVQAKYNRLLAFDSHLIHQADEFVGEGDDERLTLVFFVFDVSTTHTPIYKMKRHIL